MASQDTSTTPPASASERTAAALALLKPVAQEVSDAATELSRPVASIETALKRMNIAFEAWVTYKSFGDDTDYVHWDVGFSRVHGRWGLCLRTIDGDLNNPDRTEVEPFHFNEAPLYLRPGAVDKIPDLLEALAKTGATVSKKLSAAALRASQVAETVTPPKAKK